MFGWRSFEGLVKSRPQEDAQLLLEMRRPQLAPFLSLLLLFQVLTARPPLLFAQEPLPTGRLSLPPSAESCKRRLLQQQQLQLPLSAAAVNRTAAASQAAATTQVAEASS